MDWYVRFDFLGNWWCCVGFCDVVGYVVGVFVDWLVYLRLLVFVCVVWCFCRLCRCLIMKFRCRCSLYSLW